MDQVRDMDTIEYLLFSKSAHCFDTEPTQITILNCVSDKEGNDPIHSKRDHVVNDIQYPTCFRRFHTVHARS